MEALEYAVPEKTRWPVLVKPPGRILLIIAVVYWLIVMVLYAPAMGMGEGVFVLSAGAVIGCAWFFKLMLWGMGCIGDGLHCGPAKVEAWECVPGICAGTCCDSQFRSA